MARFDLNLLPALDALLTERHVTRAADAIHVSQPTMSGMLQRLRHQFNDEILTRVGRNMELTPFAASLSSSVREALLRVNALTQTVPEFNPRSSSRSFVLMTSDYCLMTFMPRVLRRLAIEAPQLRLHVQPMSGPIQKLNGGDIDFCITSDDWRLLQAGDNRDCLRTDVLFADPFVCILDRSHPVGATISLAEYLNYPHVQVKMAGELETPEDVSIRHALPDHRPNFTVADFMAVPYLVKDSTLIGIVQRRLAALVCSSLKLRMLKPPFAISDLHETLLWHTRNLADPAHKWMRALIIEEAQAVNAVPDVVQISSRRRHVPQLRSSASSG